MHVRLNAAETVTLVMGFLFVRDMRNLSGPGVDNTRFELKTNGESAFIGMMEACAMLKLNTIIYKGS